jgi:hypothetical protein
MNANQLLKFLSAKKWHLERTIIDHSSERTTRYSARAELCPTESGFLYEEIGELHHDNQIFEMKRRYLYCKSGVDISVYFVDGRLFYTINCAQLPDLKFKHFCDPDTYAGEMKIQTNSWEMRWTVVGPKKDLVIESSFK